MFTVKGNQPTLNDDIRLLLDETIARRAPDFTDESPKPEHGRRQFKSTPCIFASNPAEILALNRGHWAKPAPLS